jgi:hypothetical protein
MGPRGEVYHYSMKDIGTTISGTKSVDDSKSLSQCRFTIGDYVDIAITPPNGQKRFDRDNRRDGGDRGGRRRRGMGGPDRRPRPF